MHNLRSWKRTIESEGGGGVSREGNESRGGFDSPKTPYGDESCSYQVRKRVQISPEKAWNERRTRKALALRDAQKRAVRSPSMMGTCCGLSMSP